MNAQFLVLIFLFVITPIAIIYLESKYALAKKNRGSFALLWIWNFYWKYRFTPIRF